jgi:hypothetical protein
MVQIVGNLEWELLKNVEIRKSKYARITHSIRGPPFREFRLYQEKSHIFSSESHICFYLFSVR